MHRHGSARDDDGSDHKREWERQPDREAGSGKDNRRDRGKSSDEMK
jgi:hypothetical protein